MGGSDQTHEEELRLGDIKLRAGARLGAYIYRKPLAEGGMAHVLLVSDPGNRLIALKLLKSGRAGSSLARFRREFRALSRLDHPNVVGVESYGDFYGHPYIAMEYVEGRDLHQEIRSYRNLPFEKRWERVESIIRQMSRALSYIHRRGLVHRDLKPSNILIGPDGSAKLTDFGIVKDLDPSNDPFVSTTLVGTWAYASPEQIAGNPLDHRSDLYSFGVIIYAMLTGRRPFAARDMAGYLEQHRHRAPVAPSQIYDTVPEHLDQICLRLLEKAPRDRYQSGAEILEELDGAVIETAPTDEAPWEPAWVGLNVERERLRDTVSALTRGQGGVCLIEGSQGTGKSRILNDAAGHARVIGIHILEDRAQANEDTSSSLLRLGRILVSELGARVPVELERAMRLFEMGQARQPGGAIGSDLRYQLYDGVRSALEGILREEPVVIVFDDLHHAPQPKIALVSYLVRTLIVRDGLPLLVMASLGNDSAIPGLHHVRDGTELGLKPILIETRPLRPDEIAGLVASVMTEHQKVESLSDRLFIETSGNPYYIVEFLRAMISRGTIAGVDGEIDDDATEIAHGGLVVPPGIRHVVTERLAHLEPAARHLVDVVAVASREMDLELLLDVLEVDEADEESVLDRIDELERNGVISQRRAGMQTLIDLGHPKTGEVVYRDLSNQHRIELHRKIGNAMEGWHGGSPVAAEAIGEHFRRAGDSAKAYKHLAIAAGGMWGRSLLTEAWRIAELADALEDAALKEIPAEEIRDYQLHILRVRADVFYNRGDWLEAKEALENLRQLALDLDERSLYGFIGLQLGYTLRRLGEVDDSVALVESVLSDARERADRTIITRAFGRMATFAWEDGDWGQCEKLANEGLITASKESRARLLVSLSAVQASRGELALATSGLEEAEGIFREQREKREQSLVLGNLGELLTMQGRFEEALERCEEGLSLASEAFFREGEAFLRRVRASILLEVGDLTGADQGLHQSLSMSEEIGCVDDVIVARYLLGRHALMTGRADRARKQFESGLASAKVLDPESYSPALQASLARSLCLLGRLDEAEQMLIDLEGQLSQLAVPRRTQVQIHMAAVWLSMGQKDDALALLRSAWRVCSIRGFDVWGLRCLMLMSEAVEADEVSQVRSEAKTLANELMARLPSKLASYFRRQPGLSRLWSAKPL